MSAQISIREATAADWPAIWRFVRQIDAAGETFSWKRDLREEEARARLMHELPGRTFVAAHHRRPLVREVAGRAFVVRLVDGDCRNSRQATIRPEPGPKPRRHAEGGGHPAAASSTRRGPS
jgi:hypothetical protein